MALGIAALVFLGVVIVVGGLAWAFEGQRRVRERLEGAQGGGWTGDTEILRSDLRPRRARWAKIPTRTVLYDRLTALSEQAGYGESPNDAALWVGIFAFVGGLIGWLRTGSAMWGLVAAAGTGSLPVFYLLLKRQRRMQAFEKDFPDALDAMSRAIRAGNALSGAIQIVGDEMPDPIGAEFHRVFEETRLGMDPGEALSRLAQRLPTEDVRFFCTAISIQRSAGGNLAEILDRLAEVIRERFKILSHARVLSAQHKWSAICVGLSPVVFAIIFELMSPGYFKPLWESPLAPLLLGGGLLLEAIGFFSIWRIAKIKV